MWGALHAPKLTTMTRNDTALRPCGALLCGLRGGGRHPRGGAKRGGAKFSKEKLWRETLVYANKRETLVYATTPSSCTLLIRPPSSLKFTGKLRLCCFCVRSKFEFFPTLGHPLYYGRYTGMCRFRFKRNPQCSDRKDLSIRIKSGKCLQRQHVLFRVTVAVSRVDCSLR